MRKYLIGLVGLFCLIALVAAWVFFSCREERAQADGAFSQQRVPEGLLVEFACNQLFWEGVMECLSGIKRKDPSLNIVQVRTRAKDTFIPEKHLCKFCEWISPNWHPDCSSAGQIGSIDLAIQSQYIARDGELPGISALADVIKACSWCDGARRIEWITKWPPGSYVEKCGAGARDEYALFSVPVNLANRHERDIPSELLSSLSDKLSNNSRIVEFACFDSDGDREEPLCIAGEMVTKCIVKRAGIWEVASIDHCVTQKRWHGKDFLYCMSIVVALKCDYNDLDSLLTELFSSKYLFSVGHIYISGGDGDTPPPDIRNREDLFSQTICELLINIPIEKDVYEAALSRETKQPATTTPTPP